EQRRALVMAGLLGHTAREGSEAEDIPLGTAKTRIRTALLRLRAALTEERTEGRHGDERIDVHGRARAGARAGPRNHRRARARQRSSTGASVVPAAFSSANSPKRQTPSLSLPKRWSRRPGSRSACSPP